MKDDRKGQRAQGAIHCLYLNNKSPEHGTRIIGFVNIDEKIVITITHRLAPRYA